MLLELSMTGGGLVECLLECKPCCPVQPSLGVKLSMYRSAWRTYRCGREMYKFEYEFFLVLVVSSC